MFSRNKPRAERPALRGLAAAVLALLLQLLQPALLVHDAAARSFDALVDASLCTADHAPAPAGTPHHDAGKACPACQVCCTAPALPAMAPALPAPSLAPFVPGHAAPPPPARAPPSIWARARGPPALS